MAGDRTDEESPVAPPVRFEDVSIALGGEPVLRRLRAELPAGQLTVLMGESGGGKTTLVRQLVGLMQPDSGRVFIGGKCVSELSKPQLKALREDMGVLLGGATLFETSVFGSLTVYENLAYPLRLRGDDEDAIHALTTRWLRTLGLADVHARLPEELAAHTRRRVALGRAMITERPLVVLDDIDLGLDSLTTARTVQAVRDTQSRTGATMLVTTHDIELARAFDGRLAVLANGRIVANGPASELLAGVRDAADFDNRFRVMDSLGPVTDTVVPRARRSRSISYDPRLVAVATAAVALVFILVVLMTQRAAGPLLP
jgi:phospholipid/cholesterol/gamma-HCH transport system ATP-binding protein